MTDNNKFIPKLPETKTEIVLNQEQNQPQTEQKSTVKKATEVVANVVSSTKETVAPNIYASEPDEEEWKEGTERVIGGAITATEAINPLLGTAAVVGSEIVGGVEKGIGQITGNEGAKDAGEIFMKAPVKTLEDTKKVVEETFEK